MELKHKILREIENKWGDSWYFLDTGKFSSNYQELLNAFREIYNKTEIAYSYKTNYIPVICKIVNLNGGFAEVVSEMEYDLAIRIGVDPLKIIVNGPYKPEKALEKFLVNGSIVNLDSYNDAAFLKNFANKHSKKIFNIGLRCNFEFSGLSLSRFGFDVENLQFFNLVEELSHINNVRLISLHCHFPNRDLLLFWERTEKMLNLYKKLVKYCEPSMIDIGGGLGGKVDDFIKKQLNYDVADYQDYARVIATKFHEEFKYEIIKPLLILEPGTALVADTMDFVCKVLEIKKIRNKYIAITSGSKVNFHPLTSKIILPMQVISDQDIKGTFYDSIDISGYTCMEDDYLYKNYCGELKIGDYIIFNNVGSYSIVKKPPFIRPNVPIIALKEGEIEVLKTSETFEHIFQTYNFYE